MTSAGGLKSRPWPVSSSDFKLESIIGQPPLIVLLLGVEWWCIQEVHMSRMTVTIDDALLEEAKEALGSETRAEAIRTALTEVVRRRRLAQALQQRDKFQLRGDLAELQRLREEG
jgi:Arc/MetJ family transcription regulator